MVKEEVIKDEKGNNWVYTPEFIQEFKTLQQLKELRQK